VSHAVPMKETRNRGPKSRTRGGVEYGTPSNEHRGADALESLVEARA
jgi:hypothetical protein